MTVSQQEFLREDTSHGDLADVAISNTIQGTSIAVSTVLAKAKAEEGLSICREKMGFGKLCMGCGDEISQSRRDALPSAVRCLRCETEREEKRNKH